MAGAKKQAEQLTGDALQERARVLNIEGRSEMKADELRDAVEAAERAAAEQQQAERVEEHEDASAQTETLTDGGATLPPPPPAPTAADGEQAEVQSSGAIPKDALIARAGALLGVTPAVARGVLTEADDPITIDAASARIQEFLDGTVANTEEA